MKTVLDDKCRRCSGQVWYVFKSGRSCVNCIQTRTIARNADIAALRARVAELEALLQSGNAK